MKSVVLLVLYVALQLQSWQLVAAVPRNAIVFADSFDADELEDYPKPNQTMLQKCLEIDSVPYFNHSAEAFACYPLLEQGPCHPQQWLLLSEQHDEGVCRIRECEESYVLFKGKCEAYRDEQLCPEGMELLANPHGKGECDCQDGYYPAPVEAEGTNQSEPLDACYQEYLQGPCPDQHHLRLINFTSECRKTWCAVNETAWRDGKCYPAIECSNHMGPVLLNRDDNSLVCSGIVVRDLLQFAQQCSEGKRANSNGDCLDVTEGTGGRDTRNTKVAKKGSLNLRNLYALRAQD